MAIHRSTRLIGPRGRSPLEQAIANGDLPPDATYEDWRESVRGLKGDPGEVTSQELTSAVAPLKRRLEAADIAALKAVNVSAIADGDVAVMAGYHSRRDGGEGLFEWVINDTAADNGGTIIAPTSGNGRWRRLGRDLWCEQVGMSPAASAIDNAGALAEAVAWIKARKRGFLYCGDGVFSIDGEVVLDDVVAQGRGGHTSRTVWRFSHTAGKCVRLKTRSSGLVGIRIDATAERRAAGGYNDGGLWQAPDDAAGDVSTSRCIIRDVWVTSQPGFGVYLIYNGEYSDWDTITAQGCKGHPFILDDGTIAGYVNRTSRPFQQTFKNLRAFECGGNVIIGSATQASVPRILRFEQLEALDCAFDPAIRLREEQVITYGKGVILDRPDLENQRYALGVDQLGNAKPVLGTPVKGIYVGSNLTSILHPYFSSLTQSIDVAASVRDLEVVFPQIFAGTYGVAQTNGIVVPSSHNGFRLAANTADTGGAAQLVRNQCIGADLYIDGRKRVGLSMSNTDWDVDLRPVPRTIANGVVLVSANRVNLTGEGDVTDNLDFVRMLNGAGTDGGRDAIDIYLFNRNGYDIVLRHNQTSVNGGQIMTRTAADVTLNASNPVAHLIYNSTDNRWYQL